MNEEKKTIVDKFCTVFCIVFMDGTSENDLKTFFKQNSSVNKEKLKKQIGRVLIEKF
jgi:hypothetical protein